MLNNKKAILYGICKIGFLAITLAVLNFIDPIVRYHMARYYDMIPYLVWLHVYTLVIAVFFLMDHIKEWFRKGRLRADWSYAVITAALFAVLYLPNMPLNQLSHNHYDLLLILFWFSLLKTICKDKTGVSDESAQNK